VDVWLNTPRRPYEASGTSGQKVVVNGLLNLSIADGWWPEGFDGTNGWTIGPVVKERSEDSPNADPDDALSLYELLENAVIPLFYDRDVSGVPGKWIAMIKRSLQTLAPRFNTERMLIEYFHDLYIPSAEREKELGADRYRLARELADWKLKIPMRFSSLRLLEVTVEGVHGDAVMVNQPLNVTAILDPGKLDPEEILVELMIGRKDGGDFAGKPDCIPLKLIRRDESGNLIYTLDYRVRQNGPHCYGVRVLPFNPRLSSLHETGLVLWG
jgi:phosphorylase/glycogen(starch) synthase